MRACRRRRKFDLVVLDALTLPLRWVARRLLTGLAMIALAVAAGGQTTAATPTAGSGDAPVAAVATVPAAEPAAPETPAVDREAVEARHATPHLGYVDHVAHHTGASDVPALPRTAVAVRPPHDAPSAAALGQRAPPRR